MGGHLSVRDKSSSEIVEGEPELVEVVPLMVSAPEEVFQGLK